ncbi:MAG: hypothetical protein AB7P14_17370 [Blastocatellales bacterium]
MKKSKVAKLLRRNRLRAVKGGLAKLTKLTSQPDSQKQTALSSTNEQSSGLDYGLLRQDGSKLRLPTALADAGEGEREGLMPSALAFFIIFMAVVFIAIVAWRISEMPSGK